MKCCRGVRDCKLSFIDRTVVPVHIHALEFDIVQIRSSIIRALGEDSIPLESMMQLEYAKGMCDSIIYELEAAFDSVGVESEGSKDGEADAGPTGVHSPS
jgi:hypothetical protein